jgi:hypothetical protein
LRGEGHEGFLLLQAPGPPDPFSSSNPSFPLQMHTTGMPAVMQVLTFVFGIRSILELQYFLRTFSAKTIVIIDNPFQKTQLNRCVWAVKGVQWLSYCFNVVQ